MGLCVWKRWSCRGRTEPQGGRETAGRVGRERKPRPESSPAVTFAWPLTYRPRRPQRLPSVRRDTVGWGSDLDAPLGSDRRLRSDLPPPKRHCSGTGRSSSVLTVPVPGLRGTRASRRSVSRPHQPPAVCRGWRQTRPFVGTVVPCRRTDHGACRYWPLSPCQPHVGPMSSCLLSVSPNKRELREERDFSPVPLVAVANVLRTWHQVGAQRRFSELIG